MKHPLSDKVVVITGASSGIGRATARALARCGARIALAARSTDKLQELATELGDRAAAFPTDVTSGAQVRAMVAQARERFGRIDVLFANAGIYIPGQVAPHGIRVGSIAPGMVANELWGFTTEEAVSRKVEAHESLRSEDVAELVVLMLSQPPHVTIRDLVVLPQKQDL